MGRQVTKGYGRCYEIKLRGETLDEHVIFIAFLEILAR